MFASELASLLVQNNHQVLFVGLYFPPSNTLSASGAINIDLNGSKTFFNLRLLFSLIRLIKKEQPDIIQANGSDTLKYAVIAKLFIPKIKIIYRNISIISAWSKKGSMKQKFNKWLFKRVDFVTSVGQQALENLINTYNYPNEKTKMIRRGIPHFEFDHHESRLAIANEFGFDISNKILVHIGQFSPEKNHRFLIECFIQIHKTVSAVKLILIGEGKLDKEIRELVKDKGMGENVFFAGHINEVQRILAGADLFVLTSNVEGVPGVVLEAGMQSLPTLAINVGGVGEVVIDNKTGILIADHNAALFSNAAITLIQNDELRKQLGMNVYKFVRDNYSLNSCSLEFEKLYKQILEVQ